MMNSFRNTQNGESPLANRASHTTTLVCLNFKVPLQVRQQFKICAARQNMTMTQLLLRLLDDCLTYDVNRGKYNTAPEQEIKK